MSIPWQAHVQANARPETYYSYSVNTSNRTSTSIHVQLFVSLHMRWWSSYYSFKIAHECKVNGVYQYQDIKTTRYMWGHQWEGSFYEGDLWWQYGTYDYDGTAWHGPFCVFDADVPIGVDDTQLHIVPCITQPPITGMGGDGIYAWNYQDVNNWAGAGGWWRPFGEDEQIGSYAWNGGHYDGCWLNNHYLEELDNAYVGAYPRPDVPSNVKITPSCINVAKQDSQWVTGTWGAAQRASSYQTFISSVADVAQNQQVYMGNVNATKNRFLCRPWTGADELFDGAKFYLGVRAVDSSGVTSRNDQDGIAWSNSVTYFEIPSQSPNVGYLIGRKGTEDEILFRGESGAKLYYSGQYDGSYPIAKLRLYRESDGATIDWTPGEATTSVGKSLRKMTVPGVDRPREERVWELRAYNTKGRPVYLGGVKANGWLKINVTYYGGVIYVFDGEEWHEGICYVYDGTSWHESDAVHVYTGSDWKTI